MVRGTIESAPAEVSAYGAYGKVHLVVAAGTAGAVSFSLVLDARDAETFLATIRSAIDNADGIRERKRSTKKGKKR